MPVGSQPEDYQVKPRDIVHKRQVIIPERYSAIARLVGAIIILCFFIAEVFFTQIIS